MKKIVLLFSLFLAISSCSSNDEGSALNPNEVDFDPTGTLTSGNVDSVSNEATAGNRTTLIGGSSSTSILSSGLTSTIPTSTSGSASECIEESGSSIITDWSCLTESIGGSCTGSGTTVYTTDEANDLFISKFEDFSLQCEDDDDTFTCSGEIKTTAESNSCMDISCIINSESSRFVGCIDSLGNLLVTVNDESFLVGDIELTTPDCNQVTLKVTDSEGEYTVTCDAVGASSCDTSSIESVNDCEITTL